MMTDGKTDVLSWTMLVLSGSDVFYYDYASYSNDGGKTFSELKSFPTMTNLKRVYVIILWLLYHITVNFITNGSKFM